MKVLILGSGGREHAIAHKISKSRVCDQLFIAPGNAGTSLAGTNVNIGYNDFEAIKIFVLANEINFIIVGPEEPLVNGIVDFFYQQSDCADVKILGPDAAGAMLEGSKAWAKSFMKEFDIPTAAYYEFDIKSRQEGVDYLKKCNTPIVLKADGLAAGKGVIITSDRAEAIKSFNEMLDGLFGNAGAKIVIEEFLDGIEFSVFALTDGQNYQILPEAKDYKRIGEGDTGPNTGGMGAVSPLAFFDQNLKQKVIAQIVEPTMMGLQKRGIVYRGFIFFGLIKVGDNPMVIEYNCRMGDPETEVVFPRIKDDILPRLLDAANGKLSVGNIEVIDQTATTIMLVSGGYPGEYSKGHPISGLDGVEESLIFHAGTKLIGEQICTNGGRVIAVTAFGNNIDEAIEKSKREIKKINFEGKNYRSDIGKDLINYQ